MFYELRRYQTRLGRRDEWVRYMEEVVIPFQTTKGMIVTASLIDEEDQDGYLWIRRFDDEARREELYAAVYESDRWRDEIRPVVQQLLIPEKSVITRAVPTALSVLR
ncbi:NIPSNAP family protein [Streptomyces sp. NPDC058000]|uniref:NIPSNAP family protein n=1 Tax=Streptomyces sp. NPDC058000 TaxID=3346299 RepID=UPI0036E2564C